jgi:hypothetical protein
MRTAKKRHCNECPKCLAMERAYPYCRKCGRRVGYDGGEIHHEPPKQMGGSIYVWCNEGDSKRRLLKYCHECHDAKTENREVGLRER